MEEFYKLLEEKIKDSGYTGEISGEAVYEDICEQIEDKENGTYILLSKYEDDVVFEYNLTIMDEDMDLKTLSIRTENAEYTVNFDE